MLSRLGSPRRSVRSSLRNERERCARRRTRTVRRKPRLSGEVPAPRKKSSVNASADVIEQRTRKRSKRFHASRRYWRGPRPTSLNDASMPKSMLKLTLATEYEYMIHFSRRPGVYARRRSVLITTSAVKKPLNHLP